MTEYSEKDLRRLAKQAKADYCAWMVHRPCDVKLVGYRVCITEDIVNVHLKADFLVTLRMSGVRQGTVPATYAVAI